MKILVLANSGMGLYKFRKELLEQLINIKHEVYVCAPMDDYIPKLTSLGCNYIDITLDRRATNPIKDIKLMFSYLKIIINMKPAVVLTFTIKPNIYGGIACRLTKTPYIVNITGLGTAIENKGLMQKFVLFLYRIGIKKAKCTFFENEANQLLFRKRKIIKGRNKIVPGAGVNLKQHCLEEYPDKKDNIKFLFIGRIMKDKGIEELLEAAVIIKEKYPNVTFGILGSYEDGYEYYQEKINELNRNGIIEYYGLHDDVHAFIKNAHATILPSYHEGTSNVLLESASSGRPVLASKIPGCIETFDDGCSGLGFEVKNTDSLVEAIINFIELPYEQQLQMGLEGRTKMEREYDRGIVVNAYLNEMNRIMMKSIRIIY